MKKIGVLTSGGDAPGMNAAVRSIVRTGLYYKYEVYGIYQGYAGLIKGEIKAMRAGDVADIIQKGGTVLRSARSDEFRSEEGQKKAYKQLQARGIEALIVVGGDGTFRGAMDLAGKGINVIGIPATIDNDIAFCDYTIGFDTALNTVTDAINKIRDTATSHERTFIIEVMGRDSGQIALFAGLAGGAESILIPEVPLDLNGVCRRIRNGFRRGKLHSIIVVAEGAANGKEVGDYIKENTGFETRVSVLGYIQRGGYPTAYDRVLASRMGACAVEQILDGQSNLGVVLRSGDIDSLPLEEIVSGKKTFNADIYQLAEILAK